VRKLLRFAPDPVLEAQFAGWPRALEARQALALGFQADESLDGIIRDHLEETRAGPCAS
jgi:hypothetical protein